MPPNMTSLVVHSPARHIISTATSVLAGSCPSFLICQTIINHQSSRMKSPKCNKGESSASVGRIGGFASGSSRGERSKIPTASSENDNDENAKQTMRNLFSICSHIQNPELYQPHWDDVCHQATNNRRMSVVASKDVKKVQRSHYIPFMHWDFVAMQIRKNIGGMILILLHMILTGRKNTPKRGFI